MTGRRERRAVAAVGKRQAKVDQTMAQRREIIEKLQHTQQVLFALVKTLGRARIPKDAFDNLENANITMRDEMGFWVLDFIPPGAQVPPPPEGA